MTARDYSFARRPIWLVGHLVAIVAIIIFIAMGFWQLRRLADRQEFNSLLVERTNEAEVPLTEALTLYGPDQDSLELRVVSASGRYAPQEEVILLARSFNGISGHHVVTPLDLGGSRAIMVDRGWVPIDLDAPGLDVFAPPPGEVSVVGVLRKTEVRGSFGPSIPPDGVVTQVPRVDLERLDAQVGGDLAPVYIQLLEQVPAQTGELPRLVSLPVPSEGPHRGYAVQWFLFAAVTAVGYPILLRRTAVTTAIPSKPSSGP
ncbi:MAG: SURF1 family protein [Acidimicrobiia bacterium]|nr:SURF1 family protein [Acidimicrobiia bacterium]